MADVQRLKLLAAILLLSAVDLVASVSRLDNITTVDQYMNLCVDGRHQKSTPGPETGLMAEHCKRWADRSCCTAETTQGVHGDNWLNFDKNHCGPLSAKCKEFFTRDDCFYECSPNVGPWLVEDHRVIRNEKFLDIPLCKSDCDEWWEACKHEMTCLDNWSKGFNWTSGINTCPQGKPCRPFTEMYTDSVDFCNTIWGSFKVAVDPGMDCFSMSFDPKNGNPNVEVARKRASEILGVPYVPTPDVG